MTRMKFGLTNFYLFLLLLTFSEAKLKSYGGKYARDGQFPFVASLGNIMYRYCGASIIHERWVLTAAQCLYAKEAYGRISVGTAGDLKSALTYEVEKYYKHPNYTDIPEDDNDGLEYVVNDIGLIRLTENITFNDKVQPITLATEEDGSYENIMATIPSWGTAKYGGDVDILLDKHLKYINVRVLTRKECRRVWTYADEHICTSTKEHQGICIGDSGSPLVVGGVQIGVTSAADKFCDSSKPDLHTKVASFVPWIKTIMSRYGDVLPDL